MGPVRVGILGMGTVGGGTVRVLRRNAGEIARRVGREIVIAQAAVRNPARLPGLDLAAQSPAIPLRWCAIPRLMWWWR